MGRPDSSDEGAGGCPPPGRPVYSRRLRKVEERMGSDATRDATADTDSDETVEERLPVVQIEPTVSEKFQAKRKAWREFGDSISTTHRIYVGDARQMPEFLPATDVHLVVTSPPYWDLKRYDHDCGGAQLGHIADRNDFLSALGEVWRSCLAMLVPGGRMCVVVGDVCRSRRKHGRHMVEPLHAWISAQCEALGFDPLAPVIWKKVANVKTEVAGNGSTFLGKPYEPNAVIKNDIEFILMFRKPGGYRHPTEQQRHLSVIDKEDYARWFQQVWEDIPGEPQRHHPAPFPSELARRLICMFSFVGDTVLDPFWGIGNTTLAAIQARRSSIGVELDPAYVRRAKKNLLPPPVHAGVAFHEP
jgi:site-specific DNA-methyltransferase (adenine-specific)